MVKNVHNSEMDLVEEKKETICQLALFVPRIRLLEHHPTKVYRFKKKTGHFIPLPKASSTNVFHFHGFPKNIVSDCEPLCVS